MTVERTKTGKYYGYLLFACPVRKPEAVEPTAERTIGLKYDLAHFYVADNGITADPPRWLKQSQEKVAAIQKKLCHLRSNSKNYQELVQKYRLLHEHIANQRRDFLHKESRRIANAWDAVCVRGDDLGAMTDTLIQAGSAVKEAGFGMFREMLCYKLARQGKAFIQVDRYLPTTRSCSACGLTRDALHARDYRRSGWVCPECGAVHDREVNAAKNIKARGLEQFFDLQGQNRSA